MKTTDSNSLIDRVKTAFNWYRAVTLTENADGDRATSAVKDGILTVRVPKLKAPARRLISVTSEKCESDYWNVG